MAIKEPGSCRLVLVIPKASDFMQNSHKGHTAEKNCFPHLLQTYLSQLENLVPSPSEKEFQQWNC